MSLSGTLQIAGNALAAQQIALQVIGQNIANAATPGYSREEAVLAPAPVQQFGRLTLGLGVHVQGVVQRVDEFLNQRLRRATSDRIDSEVREQTWLELEQVLGELSETDLSTALTRFFGAINNVLNQPESVSVRAMAVLEGQSLTLQINRLAQRVGDIRQDLNTRIVNMAVDVNRLLGEIARLNVQIATTEGGAAFRSEAVGLRDQRNVALRKLSELIEIQTQEQASGAVNVFANGDFLVFEGTHRTVTPVYSPSSGFSAASLNVAELDAPLGRGTGKLAGLLAARDEILGSFLDKLDAIASTLAFEFNKLYSRGQGLTGYTQLTSERAVNSAAAPLDAAGLPFLPVSGMFQVLIRDQQTGVTRTHDVRVELNGLHSDTTLNDLAARLASIDGLFASVDAEGRLTISAASPNVEFAFADDTSGLLAALGLNVFFSGTTARNLGVSSVVSSAPATFAASNTGLGAGTGNAVELARFPEQALSSADGDTLFTLHDRLHANVTQGASVARAVAEGLRSFEQTLEGQQLATSGVSLDEEAIKLMTHQRAFQAAARFVTVIDELLRLLVEL
jgi:flagellar hook-associated protein 1 FlgK